MPRYAFGLDFGTSKTALTLAPIGSISPPVTEVTIDGQDRITTCFLRDKSRPDRIYLGQRAEEQYMLAEASEDRESLQFFANFKPHIHQCDSDREAARAFIMAIRSAKGLSQQIGRLGNDAVLAVGCPVSWTSDGADTLLRLLEEARFPPAFAIPEPVGATFHFLDAGLKAQDFHRDIVVFDWGAGTFDMTVLRAGRFEFEAPNTWGSTLYGGRLFDDLLYQWLLDVAVQNGRGDDVRKLDDEATDRTIIHSLTCRDIKEKFSRHLAMNELDRPWIYPSPITMGNIDLGKFKIERSREFYDRMRNYQASKMVREWTEKAQSEVRPEERKIFQALCGTANWSTLKPGEGC